MNDPLQPVLDDIAARRGAIADMAGELRRRIDELGPLALDTQARQEAFKEVLEAITPPGFDLFALPDSCRIDPVDHAIVICGAVVDQARRQVVGTIVRELSLDAADVKHEFLELQRPYRGAGLATLLLKRSFDFYDTIGVRRVLVHAALETGRWYWARLGFDFASPGDRAFVAAWGIIALQALGEPVLAPDAPARRWAQLGSGDPEATVSLRELHTSMNVLVSAALADPATRPQFEQLATAFSTRLRAGWLERERFVAVAEQNGLAFDDRVSLGRAIMLTGTDWQGVFDLTSQGARDAFEEELNRTLKKSTRQP